MSEIEFPSPVETHSNELPLPRPRYLLFLLGATLLIAAFYVFCAFALGIGLLFTLLFVLFAIGAAQYGGFALLGPVLNALSGGLQILVKSLPLREGTQYRVALTREEAPRFWELAETLSRRLNVAPPRSLFLESGVNAWVQLSGVAAGRGATKLGFGFDMLAGLSGEGARAVLAHEIAHAKHVARGYQGFLMRGLWRVARAADALQMMADDPNASAPARTVGRVMAAIPKRIRHSAGRLIAACSRYDEFLADRVAAEICGASVCQNALMATVVIDHQAEEIFWRDRLLHLERAPGYTQWLREKLKAPDDERRLEIEARALAHSQRHELNTHPALPDRLAALESVASVETDWPKAEASATSWLKNPDQSAKKLLHELERLAAEDERRATAQLAKWIRKESGKGGTSARRMAWSEAGLYSLAVFTFACFLFMEISAGWGDGSDTWAGRGLFAFFLALILGFAIPLTLKRRALPGDLPVPTFVAYRAAIFRRNEEDRLDAMRRHARKPLSLTDRGRSEVLEAEQNSQRRVAQSGELRANLPDDAKNPKMIARHWIETGFSALSQCDYPTAALCARLAFEQDKKNPEALFIHAIYSAFKGHGELDESINLAYAARAGWTRVWGMAWLSCLQFQTDAGEAYLLELTRQKPQNAMLWALLGFCQAANGKPREALVSRQRALVESQKIGDPNDEACHRFVLMQNQTSLGQLEAARAELDWLADYRKSGEMAGLEALTMDLEELKWLMASEQTERAVEWARELMGRETDPRQRLNIADVLVETRERPLLDEAESIYRAVLAEHFYPEAQLALSRLAYDRHAKTESRELLLQGLDATRERPADATHPLSLLDSALFGLRTLADLPPRQVPAWEAHFDAKNTLLEVPRLSMLCLFPTREEAHEAALEVVNALLPNGDWSEKLTIETAPANLQSEDPNAPGIYGSRWGEE